MWHPPENLRHPLQPARWPTADEAARQSLADPDWFRKVRLGRGPDVRRCTFTNYCEGLDQKHKQVTCKLWDHADLDAPGVKRTSDGKRRLTAPACAVELEPVVDH